MVSSDKSDFVTRFRDSLRKFHNNSEIAVSCNALDDQEKEFRALCGFSNLQGRYLNQSQNICTEYTEIDSDRFIHVEQDYSTTMLPEFIRAMIATISTF